MNSASITTLDAAYDGLKMTLNVMVKITDGLDWPLKAAPQTFLYILQLFEVGWLLSLICNLSHRMT